MFTDTTGFLNRLESWKDNKTVVMFSMFVMHYRHCIYVINEILLLSVAEVSYQ